MASSVRFIDLNLVFCSVERNRISSMIKNEISVKFFSKKFSSFLNFIDFVNRFQ